MAGGDAVAHGFGGAVEGGGGEMGFGGELAGEVGIFEHVAQGEVGVEVALDDGGELHADEGGEVGVVLQGGHELGKGDALAVGDGGGFGEGFDGDGGDEVGDDFEYHGIANFTEGEDFGGGVL